MKKKILCWLILLGNFSLLQGKELGYTIPVLDISHMKEFQVLVDRDEKQYYGHPTTALLEDGKTIYTVYPGGHAWGKLYLKRSEDGGKTWSEHLSVPASWEQVDNCPTIFRTVDAAGKKRLILVCGMVRTCLAISEDDGKTWSDLRPMGDWGGIVAFSSLIPLKEPGHYMALFHDFTGKEMGLEGPFMGETLKKNVGYGKPGGPKGFIQFKTFTTDGGLTWSLPEMIGFNDTYWLCEPGAIRSPDGKQIAVLWRDNRHLGNSYITFSNDEGKTWTEPREISHGALTGDRHVGKYLPDGRLFISFRDQAKKTTTGGDWVAWIGRYEDLVNDTQGDFRIRLMESYGGDCAYPGVEILPDGTIVTVTYGKWEKNSPNYIMCVRFRLEDLLTRLNGK
ncbi:MAG: sialidase family protein [Planctomycetia bacterium]|nr:sialidase family protein [Planctomycetia bacterium]